MSPIKLNQCTRLTNFEAVQKLKQLQQQSNQSDIINKAYFIHSQIDEASNYFVLNTLLNISLRHKQSERIFDLWPHIIKEKEANNNKISYSLLMKCCIQSLNISKCIDVCQWMESSNYRLKINDFYIRKLISHIDNLSDLKYIHRLIDLNIVQNENKFIKSALIAAYGRLHCIQSAQNVFDSMRESEKDIFIFSAFMKALMDNEQYQNALNLFFSNETKQNDDVSHMLAIKACIHLKEIDRGYSIIDKINFEKNDIDKQLMHSLIDFYAFSKNLNKAKLIFSMIDSSQKCIFSFNAMMNAYIQNDCNMDALILFDQINKKKDDFSYILALRACINCNNEQIGKKIIAEMENYKIGSIQLRTSLIHFYGHFGNVNAAKMTFDKIDKNEWNAINVSATMNAHICNEQSENALFLYDVFGDFDDEICAIMAIKACGANEHYFEKGIKIHQRFEKKNKKICVSLKNALIDFYGCKVKNVQRAKEIFEECMEQCDVISYGSMLNVFVMNEWNESALSLYDGMEEAMKNNVCHLFAIRACLNLKNMQKGKEIIAKCANGKNMNDLSVKMKIALIDFYGICKDENMAKNVFYSMNDFEKNDAVICAMMKALICCKQYDDALIIFDECDFNKRNAAMFVLKICTKMDTLNAYKKGCQCIEHFFNDFDVNSNAINNALIEFYGHFKDIKSLKLIFDKFMANDDHLDIVCCNSLMSAFINCNENEIALNVFDQIKLCKNLRTQMLAIKAYGNLGKYEMGKQIHQSLGDSIDDNVHFQTALIDFYGNCLDLTTAQNIFYKMRECDMSIVTLSAMMKALIVNDKNEDALLIYDKLCFDKWDKTANLLAIKACANCQNYEKGKFIHAQMYKKNQCIQTKTALIDFYGCCKDIESAKKIFFEINNAQQNIVSIGAMMSAYFVNECYSECVDLFQNIDALKVSPDLLTYRLALCAMNKSQICFAEKEQFFAKLKEDKNAKHLLNDAIIESNLISMYAQNGKLYICQNIFDEHIEREQSNEALIVWNAMIDAFGKNGLLKEAKDLFDRMVKNDNLEPDVYTYSMVLTACSHCGDMTLAEKFWSSEICDAKIKYDCIVITNLVDCVSRNGYLHKAIEYIAMYEKRAQNKAYYPMWRSLLGAALKFNQKTMAQHVYNEYAKRFKEDSEKMGDAALLLSNLYAKHSEFDKVEELRNENKTNQFSISRLTKLF